MTNTMTYRGYTASMTFDADDKIIVGRVLNVDDIITFHGESVAEFESNFHMVVDDYIAAGWPRRRRRRRGRAATRGRAIRVHPKLPRQSFSETIQERF